MQPESENWRRLGRFGQKYKYTQSNLLSLEPFALDYFIASTNSYISLQQKLLDFDQDWTQTRLYVSYGKIVKKTHKYYKRPIEKKQSYR